jgi:hypothetical protein
MVAAAPRVPFAATEITRDPSAEVVALELDFFVMPLGKVGLAIVQAILLVP